MINGHGNNLDKYEGLIRSDFSSNVTFNHKAHKIVEHLEACLELIYNYPDPNLRRLTEKIASHHGLDPSSILVSNGSAEAFYLIAHFLAYAESAVGIPSFAEYEDACKLYKHNLSFFPVRDFATQDFSHKKSVWLGNPNNPDGTITPLASIEDQCAKYRDSFFIVDQAYLHLCSVKNIDLLKANLAKNLILIRSLTKEFAIPGLRLGYIIASPEIIEKISQMRLPWSVNALAQAAGEYIMDNYTDLLPDLSELMAESLFCQKELSHQAGIRPIPSQCNFFLSKLSKGSATKLKDELIYKYGCLIRDASNFRGLDERYFRIAPQTREENIYLLEAIRQIVKGF